MQEVQNLTALREFNRRYLGTFCQYGMVVDCRDERLIDVAVLSRFPLGTIRTHVDDLAPSGLPLFRRDCLEFAIDLPDDRQLTVFTIHLKSKFVGRTRDKEAARRRGDEARRAEAEAVAAIVSRRFPGASFGSELFACAATSTTSRTRGRSSR